MGCSVETSLGIPEGLVVEGASVGICDGAPVGSRVTGLDVVGLCVIGWTLGSPGTTVGPGVGSPDGYSVGLEEGLVEGSDAGVLLGNLEGSGNSNSFGSTVGFCVGLCDGKNDGIADVGVAVVGVPLGLPDATEGLLLAAMLG